VISVTTLTKHIPGGHWSAFHRHGNDFRGLRTPFQRILAANEAMSACKSVGGCPLMEFSPVICRSTWIQLVVNLLTEYPLPFVR
jgi:hypothetical protein